METITSGISNRNRCSVILLRRKGSKGGLERFWEGWRWRGKRRRVFGEPGVCRDWLLKRERLVMGASLPDTETVRESDGYMTRWVGPARSGKGSTMLQRAGRLSDHSWWQACLGGLVRNTVPRTGLWANDVFFMLWVWSWFPRKKITRTHFSFLGYFPLFPPVLFTVFWSLFHKPHFKLNFETTSPFPPISFRHSINSLHFFLADVSVWFGLMWLGSLMIFFLLNF